MDHQIDALSINTLIHFKQRMISLVVTQGLLLITLAIGMLVLLTS